MFVFFGKKFKLTAFNALQGTYKFQCYCMRCISQSYYDVLKVPQTCSSKDVRDAFINLSKKNHPDKHLNDPTMHERFVQINEAYTVLINPNTRRAYDMTLSHKKKLEAPFPSRTYYKPHNSNFPKRPHYYQQHKTNSNANFSNASTGDGVGGGGAGAGTGGTSHETAGTTSGGTNNDTHSTFYTFMWDSHTRSKGNYDSRGYYGIKGIKRVSNAMVVVVLMIFSFFGVGIQLLALRNHARKSREQMMEKSRKYSLMHTLAQEKARLYGNKHQIEILKRTLSTTFEIPQSDLDLVQEPLNYKSDLNQSNDNYDNTSYVSNPESNSDNLGNTPNANFEENATTVQPSVCNTHTCEKCKRAKKKVK